MLPPETSAALLAGVPGNLEVQACGILGDPPTLGQHPAPSAADRGVLETQGTPQTESHPDLGVDQGPEIPVAVAKGRTSGQGSPAQDRC